MQGFLSDIYLRPSCYECKCKNGVNHSDLTIGDYWAAKVTDQDFDDDKGISLVLVNTIKGKDFFKRLNMTVQKSTMEKARICNGGFNEHTVQHLKRTFFFNTFQQGKSVREAVDQCFRIPLYRRLMGRLKFFIKKAINIFGKLSFALHRM